MTIAVAGATGIVGRGFLEHMAGRDVRILALGRRAPATQANVTHLPVDLTRSDEVAALAPRLTDVDQLVYAAVSDDAGNVVAGWNTDAHVDRNRAMLAGLLDVLEAAAPRLRDVLVLQGTKAYGTTLGRFRLPARESDPRPPVTNFYWAQEDLLRTRRAAWSWTILRPTAVVGVAEKCAINILGSVAVYATLLKETGEALHFPGTHDHPVWQLVDNHLLGEAIDWCLSSRPEHGNEIFNVSNGDATNWESLWPVIAEHFKMPVGPPRPVRLADVMPGRQPLWAQIARKHGLANPVMADLVSWEVLDGHTRRDHNAYVGTLKIRGHGFAGFRDSIETVTDKLALMAAEGLIPR